jgi:hypothetical protein
VTFGGRERGDGHHLTAPGAAALGDGARARERIGGVRAERGARREDAPACSTVRSARSRATKRATSVGRR